MSIELIGTLGTLLGIVGGVLTTLFVKGRLGDVIVARSVQETTAVETMARILEKTVDGLVKMVGAVERMASETAGHKTDSNLQWQSSREMLREMLQLLNEILEILRMQAEKREIET